jgi:ABC-type transporter Mla subunit MlaD
VVAVILIAILSYFAYTKELPWADEGYTATATFEDATTLRQTAPVRIAGVNVGEVTKVEPTPDGKGAKVTFSVDEDGLPLHDDARITIRPRLFLEGNFFLDLRPGSPSAPDLPDGGDIPVSQTATAVQLDQVLTALQAPDRENLARLLNGYGSALADEPTPEQDVGQDPDVQGESAAQALNDSFTYGGEAGKTSSQVSQALLGEEAGDLRGMIAATGRVFDELASREGELADLITNFNVTTGAFADESANLERTLAELAPLAEQAQDDLVEINASFPPLRAFARELTPGVKELPETIKAGNPWLIQTNQLLQRNELGGIARDLRIMTPPLSRGTANLAGLFSELRLFSRCVVSPLDPTGDVILNDQFSSGATNFEDFLHALASQAGFEGNFDGNGNFLRIQTGGGPVYASTPIPNGNASPFAPDNVNYGTTIAPPIGTQPLKPSKAPPIRTDVPCHTNAIPALNGPQAAVGGPNPVQYSP